MMKDTSYRFGFNGKEKDGEGEWGNSAHYDYGFRIYDPSIARFLSVDPITSFYPMLTPYQYASNRPIDGIDVEGLEHLDTDNVWREKTYGGTYTKVKDGLWVYSRIEKGQTIFFHNANGYWERIRSNNPKFNPYQHLQTGTGYGLSVADAYQDSHYADQMISMAFYGIGGAMIGTVAIPTFMQGMGANYGKDVAINYAADYAGHVVAGDGVLGSFGKIDHLDNFIPVQNTGIGIFASSVIGAGFDYSIDGGFQSVFNGTKSFTHAGTDVFANLGFGALSNPIGKSKFSSLIDSKKGADKLASKYHNLALGVLYNPKGFRNSAAKYNSYSNKASNMLDQSYQFGSQITNAAVLGITELGRAFRQEAAKDLIKNKVFNE